MTRKFKLISNFCQIMSNFLAWIGTHFWCMTDCPENYLVVWMEYINSLQDSTWATFLSSCFFAFWEHVRLDLIQHLGNCHTNVVSDFSTETWGDSTRNNHNLEIIDENIYYRVVHLKMVIYILMFLVDFSSFYNTFCLPVLP